MGTTLLDRTNPLDELRDTTPRVRSRGLGLLRELREQTPELRPEDTVELPGFREALRRRLARRPEPRPLPRRGPVRIVRHYVQRGRHAEPTSLPPVYTPPLPMMLRGAVNATANGLWKAWLEQWDRFLGVEHALILKMAERDRLAVRMPNMKAVAKLRRTAEYYTRAVWEDYLEAFGELGHVRAHVAHELAALDLLAA
jgi:hypothetical protein